MRHRRAGSRLGRTPAHRASTLRHIAAGLFEHGQVVTTIPKAKAVQPMVEKIVTLAKRGDLHARRLVIAKLGGDKRGFDWLYLPKDASEQEKEQVQKLRDHASQFFDVPESAAVARERSREVRQT